MKESSSTNGTDDIELTPISDPAEWEIDDSELTVSPQLGAVISVKLDPDELARLRQAAKARGLSQSRFVRAAIEQAVSEAIAISR
jgi:hypothetical protein